MSVGITGGSWNHIYKTKTGNPAKWSATVPFTGYSTSRIAEVVLNVTNGQGIIGGRNESLTDFKNLRGFPILGTVTVESPGGDGSANAQQGGWELDSDGSLSADYALVSVGDYVIDSTRYTLLKVTGVSSSVIQGTYEGDTPALTALYVIDQALVRNFYNTKQAIMGYTNTLRGEANTILASASTAPNNDNNRRKAVRTRKVGTAIRAGYWNEYTGSWSTPPSVSDDTSALSIAADTAPGISKTTFFLGSAPTNTSYQPV